MDIKTITAALAMAMAGISSVNAAETQEGSAAEAGQSAVTFIPSVALGYRNLEFTPAYINGVQKGKVDDSFLNMNAAATLVYRKVFFNLSYDTNLTDGEISTGNDSVIGTASLERSDLAATLGMSVFKNTSLFVGYKFGTTNILPDPNDANMGQRSSGYEQEYEESGFFIGGSYSLDFKNKGSLIGSIAYAQMDGEYTDNATSSALKYDGDTEGFSYGARWVGLLSQDFDYFIDLKMNRYEFEGRDNTFGRIDSEQNITTISAGIAFYPSF